jgi:hypothetical protein
VSLPVLQAIVLADQIYTDAVSGKKVIAGTFNALQPQHIPSNFNRSTFAYLCLTDVKGTAEIELRYVDLQTNELLIGLQGVWVKANSPLDSVELVIEVPPFPIPHEGIYAFEAHAGGALIGALRITVMLRHESASEPESETGPN